MPVIKNRSFKGILDTWLTEKIETRVLLFDIKDDRSIKIDSDGLIAVSDEFRNYFKEFVEEINNQPDCPGFLYIMHYMRNDHTIPLYIGRAEKEGPRKKITPFQRWLTKDGHIHKLSQVVVKGEPRPDNYVQWKKKLFKEDKLIEDIYFTVIPWDKVYSFGFLRQLSSIKSAEKLLIGFAGEAYYDSLLNNRGKARSKLRRKLDKGFTFFRNESELWDFWTSKYVDFRIPLFEEVGGRVGTMLFGVARPYKVLKRSSMMEELVQKEVRKVFFDYQSGKNEYDGVIYLLFTEERGQIIPLYIGVSEKLGLKGGYSENLKNVHKGGNPGFFARWGYRHAYHIGNLSNAIFHHGGHKKAREKYMNWKKMLFDSDDLKNNIPKLKFPVYFWMKAWKKDDIGLFGLVPCACTFLESQLITLAGILFPNYILNEEAL